MRAEEFDLVLDVARSFTSELKSWTIEFMLLILVVWLCVRSSRDCNRERILSRYLGPSGSFVSGFFSSFGLFANSFPLVNL
jgi:hypothetical protein